jgi:hypothetical protein
VLLSLGGAVLFIETAGRLAGADRWATWWPLLILVAAGAFWLPLFIWTGDDSPVGLAVPASLLTVNGLMLQYQAITHHWASWSYLWPLELVALGGAFVVMSALRSGLRGLGSVGIGFGVAGAAMMVLMLSIFGGWLSVAGPIVLITIGLLLLLRGRARE